MNTSKSISFRDILVSNYWSLLFIFNFFFFITNGKFALQLVMISNLPWRTKIQKILIFAQQNHFLSNRYVHTGIHTPWECIFEYYKFDGLCGICDSDCGEGFYNYWKVFCRKILLIEFCWRWRLSAPVSWVLQVLDWQWVKNSSVRQRQWRKTASKMHCL